MFNSLDGSENKLIEIRGLPNYPIDSEVPDEKKALDHSEDEEVEGDRTPTEGESEDLSLSENCSTDIRMERKIPKAIMKGEDSWYLYLYLHCYRYVCRSVLKKFKKKKIIKK